MSAPKKPLSKEELMGTESMFFTARHIEERGVGYKRGYSTLDGLFFPYRTGNTWPLVDLRAHRFTNNEYAANGGVGARRFFENMEDVYGINAYYDYRSDCQRSASFHQIGVGLERLSRPFDLRVNGYFPVKRKKLIKHCHFDQYTDGYIMDEKIYKNAFLGFNVEVGIPLCRNEHNYYYLAAGPYYYKGECDHAFGGKVRLEIKLYGYLTLEALFTHDNLFRSRLQGQIALTYPKRECKKGLMTQPVHRNEIIVLGKFCKWWTNF